MTKVKTIAGQKFSKAAFLKAATDANERVLLQVILDDNTSYTKDEAALLVDEWKRKGVDS